MIVDLTRVFECHDNYLNDFSEKHLLNEEEFDDIFCSLLNDT